MVTIQYSSSIFFIATDTHLQVVATTSGAYPEFSEREGGGGGVPRSAKEANKPNKRATELKPGPCAHQGSIFRPYVFVLLKVQSLQL